MKKILFVMLFAIMLLSVNGYADFYQCYYQNATANGVNITDEVGLLYSGIVINLGENLRCNDTVIYVTDFFDGVGEIINYGNLTFENFTIGFDLTVAGGGYINSTGNLTINNSVIFSYKSSGGNDFWIGDIASATTIINNSYIQYAGWANVDYQRGVEFFSAFDSIKNTTIDSGYYGIVIHEDGLTIDNCTFNFSTRDGIHALSNNNTLTNNLFYTNAYYDIYTNAESNLIENNSMLPTTESRVGVYLDTGSNWNIINNNTFTDDTISGIGIRIFGVDHNTVSNNTFYNISNSGSGIRMDGANYNTIVENEFFASLDFGIRIVTSSTFNTISNNTFDSLDTYAIQVEDSSVNNTIQYNDIDSIPGTGIQIYNSQSTIIQFNSVDWCGIGIDIADTGGSSNHSIIYNNTGSFNTLNGIAVENSAATSPQGKINVSYNTIRYTTNPGSSAGIWIHVSYDGYVDYNVAENNAYNNIRLHDPGYQTVRYNNVSGGPHGFWHDWTHYSNYIGNRVWNTTIDGFHSTNDLIGEYSTVYNHSFNLTDVNFKFNNIILGEVYDINVPANTSGLLKLDYSYIILNESVGPGLTVGWIYLNLTYNESKVFNESNLGIYLYNTTYSTDWIYLSSEINQVDNYAYSGNLSLFGVVAVFEEETPMTITIQYPQNTTYNSPFWANITTSEEASWCGLSMNSTINQTMTNATGNQYQNISGIASGNHNIQFVCNDTYGRNYSTGTINFTIDTTPPVRSAGSPSGTIYTASTTVSLTTNEAAVCRYATSSGISYSSMLSSTTLSTSHSWPVETIVPGTYTYYVRCNDTLGNYNTDDYTISFTKRATVIGDGGGFDIQPITIIPETRPVPNPSDTGTETSIADIPLNRPYQIPSGGLCMKVAEGLCISVFGDSVIVYNVTAIDPNQFKVLLCNQTYIEAYEINVTANNAYLCFDTSTVDVKALSIYSFNGEWNQLTNVTQIGNQICGRITSTPYMVAGFKTSDLQQLALDAIADSEQKLLINSDSELESILNQAKDAYYNCDYQTAYDLSQQIYWTKTIESIQLPLITTFGPANTILEMMSYSLVAKMLGYDTVYIDLLPIFDLSNPGKLDFRYITPVIGVVPLDDTITGKYQHVSLS